MLVWINARWDEKLGPHPVHDSFAAGRQIHPVNLESRNPQAVRSIDKLDNLELLNHIERRFRSTP